MLDAAKADAALYTIADAIRTKAFGPTPWEVASPLLDPTVLAVDDGMIRSAMRTCLVELKQVVEPAGAVTLAGLLSPEFATLRDELGLKSVSAILCGGNVDPAAFVEHVQ